MIKAVLYDADGVLIHGEMANVELERVYGIPRAVSAEFFAKEWDLILEGRADTKEKLSPYLKKWGWSGTVEDYQKLWFEFESNLDQKLITHIQTLRAQGIYCAVATNQDAYRTRYMLDHMGFAQSFDDVYASAHLGVTKPNTIFFKTVLAKLRLKPEEVMFWDDKPENVAAAKSLGMHAYIYTDIENYKKITDGVLLKEKVK